MNKNKCYLFVLTAVLALTFPAHALNQAENENFTCQGPAHIKVAGHLFKRTAAEEQHCTAHYVPQAPSAEKIAQTPWLTQAALLTQLVVQPQEDLLYVLQPFIPENSSIRGHNSENPDDVTSAYKVVQRGKEDDILSFVVLRAVKQSDGTARVYVLEITLTAPNKPADGYNELDKGPYELAYDQFNQWQHQYQQQWIQSIHTLQLED